MKGILGTLLYYNPFRSLTVFGVFVLALQWVYGAADPAAFTPVGAAVWQGAGLLIAAIGARRALGTPPSGARE